MTTYVILSRVKSAKGLLLLRAFCANLCQMSILPGPYCLLKGLRHRFSTSGGDIGDSPADAAGQLARSSDIRIKTFVTSCNNNWHLGALHVAAAYFELYLKQDELVKASVKLTQSIDNIKLKIGELENKVLGK